VTASGEPGDGRICPGLQRPRSVAGLPRDEPAQWQPSSARVEAEGRRSKRFGGTQENADPPGSAGYAISVGTPRTPWKIPQIRWVKPHRGGPCFLWWEPAPASAEAHHRNLSPSRRGYIGRAGARVQRAP